MPHALLERPATRTHPAHREGDTPLPPLRRICERTANRLAHLLRSPESNTAFSPAALKNTGHPAAFASVLGCPDAFLLHAPPGPTRNDAVFQLAEEARALGQRLLILVRGSEAATLARRFHERGCSTILCAAPEGLPGDVLPLTERRRAERERAEECLQLEGQVNRAAEELERLEIAQRQFRDFQQHEESLQRELAEHEHAVSTHTGGLGGFVKKLFGGGKQPVEPSQRITALQEQLRQLVAPPKVEAAVIEQAAVAHRASDAAFARAIAKPLELAHETIAAAHIAVATYESLVTSPLLNDDGPRFDRLLVADGENLDETEFMVAAARAEAWVLLGNPECDGYFTYLWMHLHKPGPWIEEADRRVYMIEEASHDRTEPLADRPEIELRFAADELAGIAFPRTLALADAEEFLARELGASFEPAVPAGMIAARTAVLK